MCSPSKILGKQKQLTEPENPCCGHKIRCKDQKNPEIVRQLVSDVIKTPVQLALKCRNSGNFYIRLRQKKRPSHLKEKIARDPLKHLEYLKPRKCNSPFSESCSDLEAQQELVEEQQKALERNQQTDIQALQKRVSKLEEELEQQQNDSNKQLRDIQASLKRLEQLLLPEYNSYQKQQGSEQYTLKSYLKQLGIQACAKQYYCLLGEFGAWLHQRGYGGTGPMEAYNQEDFQVSLLPPLTETHTPSRTPLSKIPTPNTKNTPSTRRASKKEMTNSVLKGRNTTSTPKVGKKIFQEKKKHSPGGQKNQKPQKQII